MHEIRRNRRCRRPDRRQMDDVDADHHSDEFDRRVSRLRRSIQTSASTGVLYNVVRVTVVHTEWLLK